MIFVPLSTLAYETLDKSQTSQAAGIYNVARTIGSSVGISMAITVLNHSNHQSQVGLGSQIQVNNPEVINWLATQNLTVNTPNAIIALTNEVNKQAMMVAFNDTFWTVMLSFIVLAPLLFIIKKRNNK